jgi:hypothetical protein
MGGCKGPAGKITRNHTSQNVNVRNMMRKFVQYTFLNLLCREENVTKLFDLYFHTGYQNTTPLYYTELHIQEKTV